MTAGVVDRIDADEERVVVTRTRDGMRPRPAPRPMDSCPSFAQIRELANQTAIAVSALSSRRRPTQAPRRGADAALSARGVARGWDQARRGFALPEPRS